MGAIAQMRSSPARLGSLPRVEGALPSGKNSPLRLKPSAIPGLSLRSCSSGTLALTGGVRASPAQRAKNGERPIKWEKVDAGNRRSPLERKDAPPFTVRARAVRALAYRPGMFPALPLVSWGLPTQGLFHLFLQVVIAPGQQRTAIEEQCGHAADARFGGQLLIRVQ